MGVIDKHTKGLADGDAFQPARHRAHGVQRGLDRLHADLEHQAGADRRECVVNVVTTDQRQLTVEPVLRGFDDHFG